MVFKVYTLMQTFKAIKSALKILIFTHKKRHLSQSTFLTLQVILSRWSRYQKLLIRYLQSPSSFPKCWLFGYESRRAVRCKNHRVFKVDFLIQVSFAIRIYSEELKNENKLRLFPNVSNFRWKFYWKEFIRLIFLNYEK